MTRPHLVSPCHVTARFVGQSDAIVERRTQLQHLATFDGVGKADVPTLLLQGETGTGKGLIARLSHDSGPRAQEPFVEVNCAAIPETLLEAELFGFEAGAFSDAKRAKPGLLETASGGTLFLDEIEALPLLLQGKLLAALGEKRVRRLGAVTERAVDVKLIAAMQGDLRQQVAAGRFRADLYYRLAVVVLELPPLRRRRDDILVLATHFLHHYGAVHGREPRRLRREATTWLRENAWPGNVRELRHLMERVTLLSNETMIDADMLARLSPPPAEAVPTTVRASTGSVKYQAMDIARRQQAKWLDLRATIRLSRLWQQQGKHAAACQVLGEIYGWFTEGFETPDLMEVRTLLTSLQMTG